MGLVPAWLVFVAFLGGVVTGVAGLATVIHKLVSDQDKDKWDRARTRQDQFAVDVRRLVIDETWRGRRALELAQLAVSMAVDVELILHPERQDMHVLDDNGNCSCGSGSFRIGHPAE